MKLRPAFTLIELLVVVAIIALLIAILLPSLGMAKKRSKTLSCLTNTRALAGALRVYVQDWGKPFLGGGHGAPLDAWDNQLLRDEVTQLSFNTNNGRKDSRDRARWCPETPTATTSTIGSATTQWNCTQFPGHTTTGSYSFNGWLYDPHDLWGGSLAGGGWQPQNCFARPLADSESDIPAFVDGIWHDMWPRPNDLPYPASPGPWVAGISPPGNGLANAGGVNKGGASDSTSMLSTLPTAYVDRHNKAVNVGFADGHGETVKLTDLPKLKWWSP